MTLDPRRCDAFLAAIDGGSLEAAAGQLNITPSAVSQRISALEQDLGTPLLVRARPCPVPAGIPVAKTSLFLVAVLMETAMIAWAVFNFNYIDEI